MLTSLASRKSLAAAVALLTCVAATDVSATTGGTIGPGNDGLTPLDLSNPLGGYFGGNLYLVGGTANIRATILGSEAGFNNSFFFGGTTYSTGGNTNSFANNYLDVLPAPLSWTVNNVAAGLLNFWFGANQNTATATATNGTNIDGSGPNSLANFFVSFLPDAAASSGQSVLLFFDDGGAGGDDNHDDLIVRLDIVGGDGRIAPVPVPAAGFLLLAALGGLAAFRRRKTV